MESVNEQSEQLPNGEGPAENGIIPYDEAPNYLTEQVINYEPNERDLFIKNEKIGDFQRLIWGAPLELKEREIENWKKMEEYITENSLDPLPEHYTDNQRIGYRILQGTGWKPDIAYTAIMDHKNWRDETFPSDMNKHREFLDSGAVYCIGRAQEGLQPVVIINVKRFIGLNKTIEEQQQFAYAFFEWIV